MLNVALTKDFSVSFLEHETIVKVRNTFLPNFGREESSSSII